MRELSLRRRDVDLSLGDLRALNLSRLPKDMDEATAFIVEMAWADD